MVDVNLSLYSASCAGYAFGGLRSCKPCFEIYLTVGPDKSGRFVYGWKRNHYAFFDLFSSSVCAVKNDLFRKGSANIGTISKIPIAAPKKVLEIWETGH